MLPDIDLPPASYRGGVLRLHCARARELEPWLDRVAVRGEVVVQFWLKPGEAAVMLEVGEEREVERIPEQLRRFFVKFSPGSARLVPADRSILECFTGNFGFLY